MVRPIFDIDVVRRDAAAFVVVVGEVDLATAPEFEDGLRSALASDARSVIVDLDRVTFIDATGLGALIRHVRSERAGRIELTRGSEVVQRLLQITGLDAELPVVTDSPESC